MMIKFIKKIDSQRTNKLDLKIIINISEQTLELLRQINQERTYLNKQVIKIDDAW